MDLSESHLMASGKLPPDSAREPQSAGLNNLSVQEKAEITDMNKRPRSIHQINCMSADEFIEYFRNVLGDGGIISGAVWGCRPFRDVYHIHEELCSFVNSLSVSGKKGLLRCYPDLAGRLAALGKLSPESTREQRSAGLNNLSVQEKAEISDLNRRYKTKFGFPFIVCARLNKKDAILDGMRTRIRNCAEREMAEALRQIQKICFLRLLDLVEHEKIRSKY